MKSHPLWTALYRTTEGGCYWIKFGHYKGPKLEFKTVLRLAKAEERNNPRLEYLHEVRPGGPKANHWKD